MTWGGLVTPLVVPPMNLAALALLAVLARRRRLAGMALLLLLLLGTPAVADALLASLETGAVANPSEVARAQAIVVLGAEVERGADGILPGPLTLQRLRGAAALARRTGLPLLVSGGIVGRDTPAVAVVMAASLRDDFGVPARWVEDRSADTWENARDSAAVLRGAGIVRVLLVTHAWHMPRALLAFRDSGLVALPAPLPAAPWQPDSAWDVVPAPGGWMRSYFALHEWVGRAWYFLRAA